MMESNQKGRGCWPFLFVCGYGGLSFLSVMWCLFLTMIVMASFCSAVETTFEPRTLTTEQLSSDTTTAKIAETSEGSNSTTSLDANTTTATSSPKTTAPAGYHEETSPKTTAPAGHHDETSPQISSSKKPTVRDDFLVIEMVRLVFNGNVGTAGFPNRVYGLLDSFLTRATREVKSLDGFDWSFELSSTLRPMKFENTTYMDFRIKHTARKEISAVFSQLKLQDFIAQNSKLVLMAECWTTRNCQNGSAEESPKLSVIERNVSMFTTVVVLCSLCLVVMVTGMVCSCLRKMKTSKPGKNKTRKPSGNSQPANQRSSIYLQASRQATTEETFFKSCPFADEEVGEDDLHSTWVIPLDKVHGRQGAVVVVTAHDTKL